MIRDARVLRAGFVPREVEHRDADVNHLPLIVAFPTVVVAIFGIGIRFD